MMSSQMTVQGTHADHKAVIGPSNMHLNFVFKTIRMSSMMLVWPVNDMPSAPKYEKSKSWPTDANYLSCIINVYLHLQW